MPWPSTRRGAWIGRAKRHRGRSRRGRAHGIRAGRASAGAPSRRPIYLFAGEKTVDFALALAKLRALFGIERLLVEGGGRINGSMLRAGVIDELSLLLAPAVDGVSGTPALFDFPGEEADSMGGRCKLALTSCEPLPGGVVWLRYRITPVAGA